MRTEISESPVLVAVAQGSIGNDGVTGRSYRNRGLHRGLSVQGSFGNDVMEVRNRSFGFDRSLSYHLSADLCGFPLR